jgi:hypothetical protein
MMALFRGDRISNHLRHRARGRSEETTNDCKFLISIKQDRHLYTVIVFDRRRAQWSNISSIAFHVASFWLSLRSAGLPLPKDVPYAYISS